MNDIKHNFAVNLIEKGIQALKEISNGTPLDDVLDKNRKDKENAALADCLFQYFRRKTQVDYIIDSVLDGRKTKPKFKNIIAISFVQSLYQKGISKEVSVDCAVSFAKKKFGAKIAGFINGTLRKLLSINNESIIKTAPENVQLNIPQEIFKKWKTFLSIETIKKISECYSEKPKLTFRLTKKIESLPDEFAEQCSSLSLPKWANNYNFFETNNPKVIFDSRLLESGEIYIQDPSTISPCSFYFHNDNNIVYDLCAAPGGKTLLLLEKMNNGLLIAADSSYKRQQRTLENIDKINSNATVYICVSSMEKPSFKHNSADFVILDVPCTNTGVLRRKPDVLWNFSVKKLKQLIKKQKIILQNASSLLKPGGHLIYSTCSIEPDENMMQVNHFLADNRNFSLIDSRLLLPCRQHDGGFSALIKKE
jgi:16S rRNA (cytosine967-C5)-methyltransferase